MANENVGWRDAVPTGIVVRRAVALVALSVAWLAAACSGARSGERTNDETASAVGVTTHAAPVAIPIAGGSAGADQCPADGSWHPCSAERRLEQSGLAPKREERDQGRVREPGLSVAGTMYHVGRGTLALFYYPDRAARERDQARLDSTRFVRWDQDQTMAAERTLIASENLLALLDSRSGTQRERVANALMAGPPQRP